MKPPQVCNGLDDADEVGARCSPQDTPVSLWVQRNGGVSDGPRLPLHYGSSATISACTAAVAKNPIRHLLRRQSPAVVRPCCATVARPEPGRQDEPTRRPENPLLQRTYRRSGRAAVLGQRSAGASAALGRAIPALHRLFGQSTLSAGGARESFDSSQIPSERKSAVRQHPHRTRRAPGLDRFYQVAHMPRIGVGSYLLLRRLLRIRVMTRRSARSFQAFRKGR